MNTRNAGQIAIVLTVIVLAVSAVAEVPQVINYQGRLTDAVGGGPVTGTLSIRFGIYGQAEDGDWLWEEHHQKTEGNGIEVTGGLFSVILGSIDSIPDSVFNGQDRWLEISVEGVEPIVPRTRFTCVPYAYYAAQADTSDVALTVADDAITSAQVLNGSVELIDIAQSGAGDGQVPKWNDISGEWEPEDDLSGGSSGWSDDGSVVRLETSDDSVGIGTANPAEKLHVDGNILVTGKATIGPGNINTGVGAFVAGQSNTASGDSSSIGGGSYNTASGKSSTVSGGHRNDAAGDISTIGGGFGNSVDYGSTIAGGAHNSIERFRSTVGGGIWNSIDAHDATIAGGTGNTVRNDYGTGSAHAAAIGGGRSNEVAGDYGVICGGDSNSVLGNYSSILGGYGDTISLTAHHSYLFGIRSTLTQDSTFMVDMPHIRFGDETDGYEFPSEKGTAGQVMATDGAGQLGWTDGASSQSEVIDRGHYVDPGFSEVTVAFNETFGAPPTVVVTIVYTGSGAPPGRPLAVSNVTTTSFKVHSFSSYIEQFDWIAIGD